MRYSFDLLAFALSSTAFALTTHSSVSTTDPEFDTITGPKLSSATTLTENGHTITIFPPSPPGDGKPTTIVENRVTTVVSSASFLIVPARGSSSNASSTSSHQWSSATKNVPASMRRHSLNSPANFNSSAIHSTPPKINKSAGTTTRSLGPSGKLPHNSNTSSSLSASNSSSNHNGKSTGHSTGTIAKSPSSSKSLGSASKHPAPSGSSKFPTSTSRASSTGSSNTTSAAQVDQQPVISTLTSVVSGTTRLIPVIIGGAFTSPVPIATTAPPTSLVATGVVASSSASALSSKLVFGIIPIIKDWTDKPEKDTSDKAIKAIKGILPEAEHLLDSLGGDKSSTPCSGSKKRELVLVAKGLPNPLKIVSDIIHTVACTVNTLSKITDGIKGGINGVKGVISDVGDLTDLTDNLKQEEDGEDDQSESESESKSKTCSKTSVTEDLYVSCFPTTIPGPTTKVTQTCTTSTSTVSGCSITAFVTTKVSTGSASVATNFDMITPDVGFTGTVNTALFASRLVSFGARGNIPPGGNGNSNSTNSSSATVTATSGKPITFLRRPTETRGTFATITSAPICNEGNNTAMGFNNEPASWCFCGNRGPFSTIDKATTKYCDFTALPTKTISLTSHSTSVNTACAVTTLMLDSSQHAPQNTRHCQCGETMVGIETSTNAAGTAYVKCGDFTTLSTITPTPSAKPDPKSCYGTGGKDLNGVSRQSFDRTAAIFAISHLCGNNRPEYTSDPSIQDGYAGDRFWFDKNDGFVMSTAEGSAVGWWPKETTSELAQVRELWLNVQFSENQNGCKPLKKFDIPSGSECSDIFYTLLDDCDTDTTTEKNGGIYSINGPNGCVDYKLWGVLAN